MRRPDGLTCWRDAVAVLVTCCLISLAGCIADDADASLRGRNESERPCTTSSQCAVGERCVQGTCQATDDCSLDGCPAGQLCGAELRCLTAMQACEAGGGCSADVVNLVGQLGGDWRAAGRPVQRLVSGETWTPQLVVQSASGLLLPPLPVQWTLEAADAADVVSVDDNVVRAGGTAGLATLHAETAVAAVSVLVQNLGPSPAPGMLRVQLFDSHSGAPVRGAQAIVDVQGDGTDAAAAPPSDAQGVLRSTAPIQQPYSLTLFAAGYQYCSVVGLDPATHNDLRLPMVPVEALPAAAATVRRRVDFSIYEAAERDGASSGLHAAIGGTSLPLTELLSKPFSLAAGDPTALQCDPATAACLTFSLPGEEEAMSLAVPDVLALSTDDPQLAQSLPNKLDLQAADPGAKRLFWALGGEFGTTDLLRLGQALPPLLGAALGQGADEGASQATPRQALEALVGLLPKLSLGLSDADPAAPKSLSLRTPARQVTDLLAPSLPTSSELDTLLVLPGYDPPGQGFIPSGFGIGADCLDGPCLTDRGTYDQRIEGLQLCAPPNCPQGVPERVADGHLALFAAAPFAGLELQPQLLAAVALSSRALLRNEVQLSGIMVPELPRPPSSSLLAAAQLPLPPSVPAQLRSRQLQLARLLSAAAGQAVLQLIRLSDLDEGRQWHIYAGPAAVALQLPAVPPGWADLGDDVGLTRARLQLDASGQPMDLGHLLQRSSGLGHFGPWLRSVALRSLSVAVE